MPHGASCASLAVAWVNLVLPPPLQDGVGCHKPPLIEEMDRVRKLMHLDDTPAPVGNAVVVAANRDEAVMADAALELEEGVERDCGQRLELGLLGREGLRHDALGSAMQPDVGNGVEPLGQLSVQVIEVAEGAGEEEVLPDVGEGPLDLSLRLGAVGPAGSGQEAVVLAKAIRERL